jgi:hypothetical protein
VSRPSKTVSRHPSKDFSLSGSGRVTGKPEIMPREGLPTTKELTIGSVNEAPLFVTNPDASQSIGIRTRHRWRSRYTVEELASREGASCYSLIQIAKSVV